MNNKMILNEIIIINEYKWINEIIMIINENE